jgi:hypothetical protein
VRHKAWLLPLGVTAGLGAAGGLVGMGWRAAAGVGGLVGLLVGSGEILDAARKEVARRWR